MDFLISAIDNLVSWLGRITQYLVLVMIAVIIFEAAARYIFNAPTQWSYDVTGWILVAYVFLGGGFAVQQGYLVRVDILFERMSPKSKALVDLFLSSSLIILFGGALIWYGGIFAIKSFLTNELSPSGVWNGPVFPAKFMVPLGTSFLLLAWTSHILQQVKILFKRDES